MDFDRARQNLIKSLSAVIADRSVLKAMSRVPRERFVPQEMAEAAYDDRPLPIGQGQTISQPYIIALMTRALGLTRDSKVLEIGTGSGYQTAILAELAGRVVSVERLPRLAEKAGKTLAGLGYRNVEVHVAGQRLGWPPESPYDAIIVTAGAPSLSRGLLAQLKEGGRMVIPVGPHNQQQLCRVSKREGEAIVEDLGGCRFVPLIAEDAWPNG